MNQKMKSESLFKPDYNSWRTAQLVYSEYFDIYAIGYKRAADMLIERVHEEQIPLDINTLVFPIVFLYRHYLELRLKSIIKEGYAIEGKAVPEKHMHHDLSNLWNKANELRIKSGVEIEKKDQSFVRSRLDELSEIDPSSQAFRYPTRRKRKGKTGTEPSLPSDLPDLNLRNFSKKINKVSRILEHIDSMMSIELEQKYYGEY